MRLCEALLNYAKEDRYPCHMPGHKGHTTGNAFLGDILKYDITEIDGMDNLHDAKGVILESEKIAATLYGSMETHFLINGSTVGILSAILGTLKDNEKILMGRNCHRSVYNAVEAGRLSSLYLYPEYISDLGISGKYDPNEIDRILSKDEDIKALVVTSPTYEGIVSDIGRIGEIAHKHGVILIVDSAHGAHFGFSEGFPVSAVKEGADLVIHSVHKTLPAPTQTALLHINGELVSREEIKKQLGIYQSSSPSYLLMAGIDDCMRIVSQNGPELFAGYLENLSDFIGSTRDLKNIKVIGHNYIKEKYKVYDADPCKILICSKDGRLTGKELYDILRKEYGIQAEMAADNYCLLIMTIMDEKEGFDRIKNAIQCIDEKYYPGDRPTRPDHPDLYRLRPRQLLPVYKACGRKGKKVSLKEAEGCISADYVSLYPPGIPFLVPGEEITKDLVKGVADLADRGLNIMGLSKDWKISIYE